jgi:sialate O-acetylesterase
VTHYDSIRIEANSLSIVFPKEAGRFTVKKNEPLKAFQIAGKDKIFYPAEAVIRDNVIIVSSAKVTQPVAVRYAWSANPEINLYDNYGMPISPFRTDEWEE